MGERLLTRISELLPAISHSPVPADVIHRRPAVREPLSNRCSAIFNHSSNKELVTDADDIAIEVLSFFLNIWQIKFHDFQVSREPFF